MFNKVLHVHLRVYAAHDVNFRDRLAIIAFHDIQHLIYAQFPTFISVCVQPGIGTKFAAEHANIRGLNMKVAVKIRFVAVKSFTDEICQRSCKRQVGSFKKNQAFIIRDPFTVLNFKSYIFKRRIGSMVDEAFY